MPGQDGHDEKASASASRPPRRPLLFPALALISGILAGHASVFFPYTTTLLLAAAVAVLLARARAGLARKAAALALLAAGFASYYLHGPGAASSLDGYVGTGEQAVRAEVIRPPEAREGYTVVMLRHDVPRRAFVRPGVIRLILHGGPARLSYGDVVELSLRLRHPSGYGNPGVFDWGQYARLTGVDAAASARPARLTIIGNRAGRLMGYMYGLRARLASQAGRTLPDESAALFRAMILGDQGGVDDHTREAFAASGTTHILSVSGSHVGLLALFVYFMAAIAFRLLPNRYALRLSSALDIRKLAAGAAIPAALFYCLLAGSETATVRSVIMLTVFLVSVLIDRQKDLLNTLAAAAIAVLVPDPGALFDISFQLSYLSVLSMALAVMAFGGPGPEGAREPGRIARGLYRLRFMLLMSVAALAGTAPLVAERFNSFSWVSVPANLAVLPVAGMAVVPVGILSCVVSASSPGGALPLAWLNEHALGAFMGVVSFMGSLPHANLHPPAPGVAVIALYYGALGFALIRVARVGGARANLTWRRAGVAAGVALLAGVLAYAPGAYGGRGGLRVSFLDVGQGDCALVEFPDGAAMLIDGGGSPRGADPGRAAVAPYLWNRGIRRLNYVVLSHPQPDHLGGLLYILERFDVGQVWEGGAVNDDSAYTLLRRKVEQKGIPRRVMSGLGELDAGGAKVQVLHTASVPVDDRELGPDARENNRSLVLRVLYGDVSFLFTGDAERAAQYAMLAHDPPLPLGSTVIKLPHHGSRDAAVPEFLEAVSPSLSVASAGKGNPHGHPSPEAVEMVRGLGARLYRTDEDGAVCVYTDGKGLSAMSYDELKLQPAGGWPGEAENLVRLLRRSSL